MLKKDFTLKDKLSLALFLTALTEMFLNSFMAISVFTNKIDGSFIFYMQAVLTLIIILLNPKLLKFKVLTKYQSLVIFGLLFLTSCVLNIKQLTVFSFVVIIQIVCYAYLLVFFYNEFYCMEVKVYITIIIYIYFTIIVFLNILVIHSIYIGGEPNSSIVLYYGNEVSSAAYNVIALFIAIHNIIKRKYIFILFSIVFLYIILFSYSRTVNIMVIVMIGYLILSKLNFSYKKFRNIVITIAILFPIAFFLFLYLYYGNYSGIYQFFMRASSARVGLWYDALKLFLSNIYIGVGAGNMYLEALKRFDPLSSQMISHGYGKPHNIIMYFLGTTGLIGTIPFVFFIGNMIKKIFALYKSEIEKSKGFILSTFAYFIIFGLFDVILVDDSRMPTVAMWFVIGYIYREYFKLDN